MASSITLTEDFRTHFKISDYSTPKKGGQKTVFYVKIEGTEYALKLISFIDPRIQRELRICSEYQNNEGIPKILQVETYGKETVIIEEYIDGDDLSDIYTSYTNQEEKIRELMLNICNILIPVWENKYVHRDLKPQNIRIRKNGKPVILDFGIARALDESTLTLTGSQPFSYPFASPEQYAGNRKLVSYRTDFFCLGIIAYYLFTNKLPFGNSQNEINNSFINNKTTVLMNSKVLENFCNAVFKVNPSERPRKPETLLKLL
jgi:eukaryotic-like serine/threonine-protein kinase